MMPKKKAHQAPTEDTTPAETPVPTPLEVQLRRGHRSTAGTERAHQAIRDAAAEHDPDAEPA